MKRALITGIFGQDGSFLCEKLWQEGYEVYGICRQNISRNSARIKQELEDKKIIPKVFCVNLYDYHEVSEVINKIHPDEIYHLAACHFSSEKKESEVREQEMYHQNVLAASNILAASMLCSNEIRVLTAGSCLVYDGSDTIVQTECTGYCSKSLYGLAKIAENALVRYYRDQGLYACTAILYNHESHRRASCFVTKKIVENLIKIKKGEIKNFTIGDLEAEKDWGYAGEYAEAMHKMLQAAQPKDYIIASNETHSVYEFLNICAEYLGIEDVRRFVHVDYDIITRKVNGKLRGDAGLIEKDLNWKSTYSLEKLAEEMLNYELER